MMFEYKQTNGSVRFTFSEIELHYKQAQCYNESETLVREIRGKEITKKHTSNHFWKTFSIEKAYIGFESLLKVNI